MADQAAPMVARNKVQKDLSRRLLGERPGIRALCVSQSPENGSLFDEGEQAANNRVKKSDSSGCESASASSPEWFTFA